MKIPWKKFLKLRSIKSSISRYVFPNFSYGNHDLFHITFHTFKRFACLLKICWYNNHFPIVCSVIKTITLAIYVPFLLQSICKHIKILLVVNLVFFINTYLMSKHSWFFSRVYIINKRHVGKVKEIYPRNNVQLKPSNDKLIRWECI